VLVCFVQYPATKLGLRSFMILRPKQIRRMREKDRITCGCSHHENLRLGIGYFNMTSRRVHEGCPCPPDAPCQTRGTVPESCHALMDYLLCDKPEGATQYARACVEGSCGVCGGGAGALQLCEKERRMDGSEVRMIYVLVKPVWVWECVLKTCG
jgi:hypothetical protein